jgi:Flp pilus assembly protein, ATPase CpaF
MLRRIIVQRAAFLVVGGTGSGKTTLLSAMLSEVVAEQRIICIEDTAELRPSHPNVVNLVSRAANIEGAGEVTTAELLRQALRMRPDRIVVGEIRGAEVVDLLAALNTGHDGGAGTVHANSIAEVPARLEALAIRGGLDARALHTQLAAAVQVVLMMRHTAKGRRLAQIGVLRGNPVEPVVIWEHGIGRCGEGRRHGCGDHRGRRCGDDAGSGEGAMREGVVWTSRRRASRVVRRRSVSRAFRALRINWVECQCGDLHVNGGRRDGAADPEGRTTSA